MEEHEERRWNQTELREVRNDLNNLIPFPIITSKSLISFNSSKKNATGINFDNLCEILFKMVAARTRHILGHLSIGERHDYDLLKAAILKEFNINPLELKEAFDEAYKLLSGS